MIKAIIFSNNSPVLLKYFLDSFKKSKGEESFDIAVLYNASDENYALYKVVFSEFNINETVLYSNFKEDLLSVISSGEYDLVTFFKDTNYFIGEIPACDLNQIMSDDNIFCFSLSLGRNITHCYHNDVYNILLNEEVNGPNTIKWNWVKHYLDFGRPLELGGGHIFHRKEIYKMFKRWKYENIQGLEDCFDQLDYYPKEQMSSFERSVLVDVITKNNDDLNSLKEYDFSNLDRKIIEI